jgi:hypothetical protein
MAWAFHPAWDYTSLLKRLAFFTKKYLSDLAITRMFKCRSFSKVKIMFWNVIISWLNEWVNDPCRIALELQLKPLSWVAWSILVLDHCKFQKISAPTSFFIYCLCRIFSNDPISERKRINFRILDLTSTYIEEFFGLCDQIKHNLVPNLYFEI